MWVFLSGAYLSIVADRNRPSDLLVRARFKGDIERVIPEADVVEGAGSDYRFRANVPRNQAADMLSRTVTQMTATNFKASVSEHWRHDVYFRVWDVMSHAQEQ